MEKFISEVQAEEAIWNKEIPQHHNRDSLHVSWCKVAVACVDQFNELDEKTKNIKIDELKKKWRSIRDSYRKKCVTKSGQAASKVRKYVYADILEFLRPVMENRKTEGNFEESTDSGGENDDMDQVDDRAADTEPIDSTLVEGQLEETLVDKRKCYNNVNKKINKQPNFENKLLDVLKNRTPEVEDPDKSFFLSLLPQIRELTSNQKLQLYSEIINSIKNIKGEYPYTSVPRPRPYPPNVPFPPYNYNITQNQNLTPQNYNASSHEYSQGQITQNQNLTPQNYNASSHEYSQGQLSQGSSSFQSL